MTGAARLIEAFPDRNQNVLFVSFGIKWNADIKEQWKQSIKKLWKAVEDAIQAGGRHFICRNKDWPDYNFIKIVTQLRNKYPHITINVCYKCKRMKRKGWCSEGYDEYKGINRVVTLYPDPSTSAEISYIEYLVMASAQVIGLVRHDIAEKGPLLQYCERHNATFVNAWASPDESRNVDAKRTIWTANARIERIMHQIFLSPEVKFIYQRWQIKRGAMIGQLQKRGVSCDCIADLQRIDEEYQTLLKDNCMITGSRLVKESLDYLIDHLERLQKINKTLRDGNGTDDGNEKSSG